MNIAPIQRQSMISLLSTLAFTAVGFFSTIYFAHSIGPAPLGEYFLFLAYFGIFNLIGDGGFGGAAVKRISEGGEQNEYLSAFVFLRILLLTGSISALLLMVYYFSVISSGVFFWLLCALVISVFSSSTAMAVYGSGKVGVYQISAFLDAFIRVIVQVIAVFFGYSAGGLAGGFVGGIIAGGIVNFWHIDLRLVWFKRSHLKNLLGFSMWIFLTSSGALVFSYADTILIGYFLGNADVGIYRTAFQLTSVATFTTLALHTVLYPKISSWDAQKNTAAIQNALSRAFTYSLFLAVPVCAGGWVLGERLLYFLYGASFARGADTLNLLLLVQVANVFMYLGTMSLNSLNRPKDAFLVTAVASIVNIVLDVYLIPVFGIMGAAAATLIAMALNAFFAFILLSRIITVKLEYKPVRNIILSALLMGIAIIIFRILVPLNNVMLVLGATCFGAGLYAIILLKIDKGIHDEIQDLSTHLGLPWPRWLREGF
jgi:O-antigen/teichoic acid export membrane protein